MRRLMLACVVLLPAFLHAQLKIQLDGWDANSPVRPGETLVGTVSTQGTYGVVLLVGEGQPKVIQALQSPTYQFSLQIPADIIAGLYGLSVMARQWTYAQTLVNGIPVEVATEIEVEFFLPN